MRIEISARGAQRIWWNGTEIERNSYGDYRESFRKLIQNPSCDDVKIHVFAQRAPATSLFPLIDALSAAAEGAADTIRFRHMLLFINDDFVE